MIGSDHTLGGQAAVPKNVGLKTDLCSNGTVEKVPEINTLSGPVKNGRFGLER